MIGYSPSLQATRAETRLTVYRAHASKLNLVSEQIAKVDHKSEDISRSVNRIDSGAIFPPRLTQELSRNAFVVSILFPERIPLVRKDFLMHPKNRDFS